MAAKPSRSRAQIDRPRLGVMPAWQGRLDDPTIKMLAVYVHTPGRRRVALPAPRPVAGAGGSGYRDRVQPRVGA